MSSYVSMITIISDYEIKILIEYINIQRLELDFFT